uniref:Essential meiotic structure-specific endonuclease 1 n=1 Tax=Bubo bubo TaxID=30461 RepID=A0A8C0IG20_BUBBB
MAESELRSEESEEEELPTLASLLQPALLPPPGGLGHRLSSSPEPGRAAGVVVVVSSGSEEEEEEDEEEEDDDEEDVVEVVPLPERIKRRVGAKREMTFEPPQTGGGDAGGGAGFCAGGERLAPGSGGPGLSGSTEEGDEWTEEPNVLVLLRLEEFLAMVHHYKQEAEGCTEGQKETLQSYVAHVMEKMPGKILALAVVGVENYFRIQSKERLQLAAASGNQEEKQGKRRKKTVKDSGLEITRLDVENALVDLQLCKQVQVSFFKNWEELGEFATMFTKAVAEAPFKREREKTGFSFYLEKGWCGGVKVDHSGKGLLEVWKRQIQQFNRVSLEMAEAVVSAYPSPQLLTQAYSRCSSEQERENMLANIPVRRGDGVTATSRRVGPELSRRIYLQMTSHDPDLYLDFTG